MYPDELKDRHIKYMLNLQKKKDEEKKANENKKKNSESKKE